MNKVFKGHRHWVEQKEPAAYKAPQAAQDSKPSVGMGGRRKDGGPMLAGAPQADSAGRAELMAKMRELRGGE